MTRARLAIEIVCRSISDLAVEGPSRVEETRTDPTRRGHLRRL